MAYETITSLEQKYKCEREKRIAFEHQLNNTIISWENMYGERYTTLYDENGNIRREYKDCDELFRGLKEMGNIIAVLKKLKRNRHYKLEKMVKRRYKLKY